MRTTRLGICTACVLLTSPFHAAAVPINGDEPGQPNTEALAEREPAPWEGRHHHPFHDEKHPNAAAVGAVASEGRDGGREPVGVAASQRSPRVRAIKRWGWLTNESAQPAG